MNIRAIDIYGKAEYTSSTLISPPDAGKQLYRLNNKKKAPIAIGAVWLIKRIDYSVKA